MGRLLLLLTFVFLIGCKSDGEKRSEAESPAGQSAAPAAAAQNPQLAQSISRGREIYNNFCASCHLATGEGIPNVFPPVNGSDWLTEKRRETIRAVKHGIQGPITVNGKQYDNLMPDLGLEDEEVADVLNYIFQAWENEVEPPVTAEEVGAVKK